MDCYIFICCKGKTCPGKRQLFSEAVQSEDSQMLRDVFIFYCVSSQRTIHAWGPRVDVGRLQEAPLGWMAN